MTASATANFANVGRARACDRTKFKEMVHFAVTSAATLIGGVNTSIALLACKRLVCPAFAGESTSPRSGFTGSKTEM